MLNKYVFLDIPSKNGVHHVRIPNILHIFKNEEQKGIVIYYNTTDLAFLIPFYTTDELENQYKRLLSELYRLNQ